MKLIFSVFLIFAITITGGNTAETNALPTKITIGLETYEDVTWGVVTPSTVSIHHKTGIAKIPLAKLPPELQQRFGYDPAIAAAHRAQELAAQAQFQAANVEAAKRRWEKQQADALAAEAAKATNQTTQAEVKSKPVFTIRCAQVYAIYQISDSEYTATILTDKDARIQVIFNRQGLDYLNRKSSEGNNFSSNNYYYNYTTVRQKYLWTVFATKEELNYSYSTNDIFYRGINPQAFRLVGSGEHTDITGATTYSW